MLRSRVLQQSPEGFSVCTHDVSIQILNGLYFAVRPLTELQWSLYSVTPGLAHKQFIPLWRCKV